jgi:NADH dehydrogenase
MSPDPDAPHVVVVGAGFGGLTAARELERQARKVPLRVTLIDRRNHHTFQPLLYQVATSGLQPQDVGHALRATFRRRWRRDQPVDVLLGEVTAVDREARIVHLSDSQVDYDHLVVAAGAVTSEFGLPGVAEYGFGLKSLPEALALRDHLLRQFEDVHSGATDDPEAALTFVIAGGGPTGVELAGAISELVHDVLRKDHPWLDTTRVRIVLLEMANRLLGAFHEKSGENALTALQERGVDVRLSMALASAEADHVVLHSGEVIPTRTLVWVAGVRAHPLAHALDSPLTTGGRVVVTPTLQLPSDPHISVIGDLGAATNARGEVEPQLAPVAIQSGRYIARNMRTLLDGRVPAKPFRYLDKGTMATIGRHDAVAELPLGIRLTGFVAWVSWLVLHLYFLVGFRNRLAVGLSWLWNWVTFDRSSRLILHAVRPGMSRESTDLDRSA